MLFVKIIHVGDSPLNGFKDAVSLKVRCWRTITIITPREIVCIDWKKQLRIDGRWVNGDGLI